MVLKLYKVDISPPVRAVLMVIEKLKLKVNYIDVDLFNKEHLSEEYQKMNPQHTVPTLVDDDLVIGDSHAICTYLISKYGKDDSLYPNDPKKRAIIDQRLHFDSGILFPAARGAFAQVIFQGNDKFTQDAIDRVHSAYDFADKFASNTWLAGDQFTVADICCVSTVSSLNEVFPIDAKKYPNLYAWLKRCSEVDIYKAKNEQGNKDLGNFIRSKLA